MRISDWSSDVCSSDLLGPRFSGETPVVQAFLCLSEAPGKPERRVRVPLGAKSRRRRRPRADAGGHSHPRALVPAAPPLADARLQPGNSSRRISAGRKKSYFCKDGFAACAAMNSRTCGRSEEHTSELQSLIRISYAVFCLK